MTGLAYELSVRRSEDDQDVALYDLGSLSKQISVIVTCSWGGGGGGGV